MDVAQFVTSDGLVYKRKKRKVEKDRKSIEENMLDWVAIVKKKLFSRDIRNFRPSNL